ncbi:MAG: TRAP transporter substrate-binding protein DctP [Spirochaetaceae bacterium]|jgi:TRAP-type C4-dicarboxylate transport system substrate-binding protein|nr:TRAP transporter substrate-binding protein DctP [Spirochaetaceae bacterium]
MKHNRICIVALVFLCLIPATLFAQRGRGSSQGNTIEIKIASPVPENSLWGTSLNRIAAEWTRISGGQIRVRVLHGGTEGGEAKMLSSLDTNQIQAAVFTTFGLSAINPAILTVSCPFLIRNDAELDLVLREVQGDFEARINDSTDYVMIAWSKAGWVNIFSRDPVFVPDDLRRMRLATNSEAGGLNTVFKTMGFQLVETDIVDVAAKMASGTITAVYQSPAAVAAYRLYITLRNMASINIAPFLGGIVMNKVTWEKIDPRHREEMLRATRRIAAELDASMQRTVDNSITVMSQLGLTINRLSAEQEQLWTSEIGKAVPGLLGTTFDRGIYQKIDAILRQHRGGQP